MLPFPVEYEEHICISFSIYVMGFYNSNRVAVFWLLHRPFRYRADVMIFIYCILCISDDEGTLSS